MSGHNPARNLDEFLNRAYAVKQAGQFEGGCVYSAIGPSPNIPKMSKSTPNPMPPELYEAIEEEAPVELKIDRDANWVNANDVPNSPDAYQSAYDGVTGHPSYGKKYVVTKNPFDFLRTRHAEVGAGKFAAAILYGIKGDYSNLSIPVSRFMKPEVRDLIPDAPMPKGGCNNNNADGRYGNVHGPKPEMDFVAKATVKALITELALFIHKRFILDGKVHRDVHEWSKEFHLLFESGIWDYFYQFWVKIHRKSEVIKKGKIPRMIWAVDMMAIVIDFLVFTNTMKAHKNQFERGYTHGLTPKGAGFTYLIDRIANYYTETLFTPEYTPTRIDFLGYMGEDPEMKQAQFPTFLASNLFSNDDDVGLWDFSQFPIAFDITSMMVLYAHNINLRMMTADEAILLFLMCYSSQMRAVGLVNIKKNGTEQEHPSFVVRGLKSGEYLTAHGGSCIHSQERMVVNVRKWLMIRSMEKNLHLAGPNIDRAKLSLCLRLAKVPTPAMHHSDDFWDLVINLAVPIHALFDTVYNYAMAGMVLKAEHGASKRPMMKGINFDEMLDLVDPALAVAYGLRLGTEDGVPFKTAAMFKEVLLHNPLKRFHEAYKPMYTRFVNGQVVIMGGQFLQFNVIKEPKCCFIMVRRGTKRLFAKFCGKSVGNLTPTQHIARIRSYAYLTPGQPEFHDMLYRIEKNYRAKIGLTDAEMASRLVVDALPMLNEMKYNLGGLTVAHITNFPTYDEVIKFYTPAADTSGKIKDKHYRMLQAPPRERYLIPVGAKGNMEKKPIGKPVPPHLLSRMAELRLEIAEKERKRKIAA